MSHGGGSVRVAVDLRIADRPGMERSGVGRYAIETARALSSVRPNWQLTVFSNRDLLKAPNVTLHRTQWPTERSWARVGWLHVGSRLEIRPKQFDCWIGMAFTLPLWWRHLSVVTIHDLMFLEHRATYSSRLGAVYATAATKRAAQTANTIICGSSETRRLLAKHWSIDPGKVLVTPYGVSEVFFSDEPRPLYERRAFVLYVGTFEPRKGLNTLHAAMRALNAQRALPVELVLAGRPGWGAPDTLERLRADPHVTFRIDPSDKEIAELYRRATVLAYPSRAEGFGLPVAEAMASGCAVVSSDLACVREFAGEVPCYVPPGDERALQAALDRLLADEPERHRRQIAGRKTADVLRWRTVGEALAAGVESVLP